MRRILFLGNAGAIHTARWVSAIAERGYEVHVATVHNTHLGLHPSVTVHVAPFTSRPIAYYANTRWLRNIVRQLRPSVLHAHYASGYGGMAACVGFHPTLVSVWGSDVYEFPLRSPLHRRILERNLRAADRVLSTSAAMAEVTRTYTARPIDITPFGVDLSNFYRRSVPRPFAPPAVVIGTVKSLEQHYGIRDLVHAFRIVKSRHPVLPLKLLLVGGGSQACYLKSVVRDLGLERDAVFTGFVPHAQIPDYQNMLDISVTLSLRESFGVSVVEAGACEVPAVVSRVGGLPEVVQDGVTGFVVDGGKPSAAAAAIEVLLLNRNLAIRMGRAARERASALYDWRENVGRVVQIYEGI